MYNFLSLTNFIEEFKCTDEQVDEPYDSSKENFSASESNSEASPKKDDS